MPRRRLPDHWAPTVPFTGAALVKLPRVSAAQAKAAERGDDVEIPLARILLDAPLPDPVLATLIATAGPNAAVHACLNAHIGEDLWTALYRRCPPSSRRLLVTERVLSDHQQHHIVHVAAERDRAVLLAVLDQLSDADLATLSRRPLPRAAHDGIAEQQTRRQQSRRARFRPLAGAGAGFLYGPADPQPLDPTARVDAIPDTFAADLHRFAAGLADYLLAELGDDLAAWDVLTRLLQGGFTGTWERLVGATHALTAA